MSNRTTTFTDYWTEDLTYTYTGTTANNTTPSPRYYLYTTWSDSQSVGRNAGRSTDPFVVEPNPFTTEVDEEPSVEERLIEFYQWLKEDAREIELEDPDAARCVESVIRDMKRVFLELLDAEVFWESYEKTRLPCATHVTDYQNLVTFGGSDVERFREHG